MGTRHGHPKAETQGAPALLHRSEIGLPQQFSMLFGQGSNLVDPGFGVAPVEYTVWIDIMRDTLAVGRMDHLVQNGGFRIGFPVGVDQTERQPVDAAARVIVLRYIEDSFAEGRVV